VYPNVLCAILIIPMNLPRFAAFFYRRVSPVKPPMVINKAHSDEKPPRIP
jgi:hypothetical protein